MTRERLSNLPLVDASEHRMDAKTDRFWTLSFFSELFPYVNAVVEPL